MPTLAPFDHCPRSTCKGEAVSAMRPLAHRTLAVGAHVPENAGRALERKLATEFIGTFFLARIHRVAGAQAGNERSRA
jgi:hypothetical protein